MKKNNNSTKNKKNIREYIRFLRNSIQYPEKYISAQLITNKILSLNYIHQAKNIAIFISIDGEISTKLLINTLLFMNKNIYLPILPLPNSESKLLSFAKYTLTTPLIRNHLNIYEPKKDDKIIFLPNIKMLNILFIPLVAFDKYGNRLGMGGGFYDATLQYYHNDLDANCICIGLGYDFQKVPTKWIPIEKWDIKLDKIITPYHCYWRNKILE